MRLLFQILPPACLVVFALGWVPSAGADPPSMLKTRLVAITQSSKTLLQPDDDPVKARGTLAFNLGLCHAFGTAWAFEVSAGFFSQELAGWHGTSAGSLELLPITAVLQWYPVRHGTAHPYAGAGVNTTVFWGKTGGFDYLDIAPTVGPALQFGTDVDLTPSAVLNLDISWHPSRIEWDYASWEDPASPVTHHARLKLDPFLIGAGIGFRF